MLVQFTVIKDNSSWVVDTVLMNYMHTESLERNAAIIERGKLIFVGMHGVVRIFAMEGRTVATDGPGAGICTFGYAIMDLDTTLTFFIQANVPITNLNSVHPIETVKYELIPGGNNESDQELPRQEEPEVSGSVSETAPGAEPITPEANVEPGN